LVRDPEVHADVIRRYVEAGFDEIFIAKVGEYQRGFLDFFSGELRRLLS
jgi:hypothetical protein